MAHLKALVEGLEEFKDLSSDEFYWDKCNFKNPQEVEDIVADSLPLLFYQNNCGNNIMAGGNPDLDSTNFVDLFNKLHYEGLRGGSLPEDFSANYIPLVCLKAKSIFSEEKNCLQLQSPVILFGDLHGEFHTLVKLIEVIGKPPQRSYMFLGDYVDRGPHSIETILYLFLLKILFPKNIFLLRGNHEDQRIFRFFSFEEDLIRYFGFPNGQLLSGLFNDVFCYMSLCATINNEIFCCHGGISPHFTHPRFADNLEQLVAKINEQNKPIYFKKWEFLADLLWSDAVNINCPLPRFDTYPDSVEQWLAEDVPEINLQTESPRASNNSKLVGNSINNRRDSSRLSGQVQQQQIEWIPNPRGCSYVFTHAACRKFLNKFNLRYLIRAHMFIMDGIRYNFNETCITLFSAADYAQKYHNAGVVMHIKSKNDSGYNRFPGKFIKYFKRNLLEFNGTLPLNYREWPDEIIPIRQSANNTIPTNRALYVD